MRGMETPSTPRGPDSSPANRSLAQRARAAVDVLEAMGWGDAQIRLALGVDERYFRRVRHEASEESEAADIAAGTFGRRQINERIVGALEGLATLVESPPAYSTVDDAYVKAVCRDLRSLHAGDRHTLVTFPPPLETYNEEILTEALRAARRGAELHYYFPSPERIAYSVQQVIELVPVYEAITNGSGDVDELIMAEDFHGSPLAASPLQTPGDRLQFMRDQARRVFGWIKGLPATYDLLLGRFLTQALFLDATTPPSERSSDNTFLQAAHRICFYELRWVPLSLNEKIIWITKKPRRDQEGRTRVFREVLLATSALGDDALQMMTPYGASQRWCRVAYPADALPLAALLKNVRTRRHLPDHAAH